MASAFKTTVAGLQKELEALITDNQIQVFFFFLPDFSGWSPSYVLLSTHFESIRRVL